MNFTNDSEMHTNQGDTIVIYKTLYAKKKIQMINDQWLNGFDIPMTIFNPIPISIPIPLVFWFCL